MTIEIPPELEAMIRTDLESGRYQSIQEYVADAIRFLHEQEEWLESNRAAITARIEHALAQADRGELIDGEEAFKLLREERARRRKTG